VTTQSGLTPTPDNPFATAPQSPLINVCCLGKRLIDDPTNEGGDTEANVTREAIPEGVVALSWPNLDGVLLMDDADGVPRVAFHNIADQSYGCANGENGNRASSRWIFGFHD
jgi:hypothetical protein